jgi:hypothetical protein
MTFLRLKLLHANSCSGLMCLIAAFLFVASCANQPNLRVVTFEAAIDRDGRTQPVARETFHLLKGNLIDLLGGNGKDPNGASRLSDVTGMLIESSNPEGRARMHQVFKNHGTALTQTDALGKAKFAPVLPGTYYIVGWTRVGENQLMVWNCFAQKVNPTDAVGGAFRLRPTGLLIVTPKYHQRSWWIVHFRNYPAVAASGLRK